MIRAGTLAEANRNSGEWVFIDLGFAKEAKSCGLLIGENDPEELTFSDMINSMLNIIGLSRKPLNLLIEAPLSIAFDEHGNPTGRAIEKRGRQFRYWYLGLGCCVLVAATYLLRSIHNTRPRREVRLFEGFASFKPRRKRSSHSNDILKLREAIWSDGTKCGEIVPPHRLAASPNHKLCSAFEVAGMDFGIPTVVELSR
jgi:hypothetical protein